MLRFKFKIFILSALGLIIFSGCATRGYEDVNFLYREPEDTGIYHKVQKGETVWRISKLYNVHIDDIIRANRIPDVAQIEEHQLLLIPGATEVKEIVTEIDNNDKDFVWPIQGKVLRFFREVDDNVVSKGIDIQARQGQLVNAARSGQVVFADQLTGYGHTIILDHQDGYYTVYSNNESLLVNVGELVRKTMPIAKIGRTGKSLAYLHFQVRKNAVEDNPLYYLP